MAFPSSNVFESPSILHITPFHTKNNFKRNNMNKKPSHTNNMYKQLSPTNSPYEKPPHTNNMYKKLSHTNNLGHFIRLFACILLDFKKHTRKTHTFLHAPQTYT